MSDHPDVEGDDVGLLWSGADGEGMPLERRDCWDVDEDVVSGLEGKMRRSLDHQAHNAGRQHHT